MKLSKGFWANKTTIDLPQLPAVRQREIRARHRGAEGRRAGAATQAQVPFAAATTIGNNNSRQPRADLTAVADSLQLIMRSTHAK